MRPLDLTVFKELAIPNSRAELLRGLTAALMNIGVTRYGYAELPDPWILLKHGVYPRTLTTIPEFALSDAYSIADSPFDSCIRALREQKYTLASEPVDKAEQLYYQRLHDSGLHEGVVFPVPKAKNAIFSVVFENKRDLDFAMSERLYMLDNTASMVHMAIRGRPELADNFKVPGLTARVKQILHLKVRGMTNDSIACELGIKADSVKKAIARLSQRMGGLRTTEMIYYLARMNLI